nr:hypothetical protein CJ225_08650 [Gardnerella vaginalis]
MINNALNLKARVYQIFEHCDLPLHNNHDEQQIHSTTLVRKITRNITRQILRPRVVFNRETKAGD